MRELDFLDEHGVIQRGKEMDVERLDMEKWRSGIVPTGPRTVERELDAMGGVSLTASAVDTTCEESQHVPMGLEPSRKDVAEAKSLEGRRAPRGRSWWKEGSPRFYFSPRAIRSIWVSTVLIFGYLLFDQSWAPTLGRGPIDNQIRYLSHSNPVISTSWHWVLASSEAITQYEASKGREDLHLWIEGERRLAIQRIVDNIGPPAGAGDGIVIASPSMGDTAGEPDYYYTWTRDAALTISALLPSFLPTEYERPWEYQVPRSFPNDTIAEEPLLEPLIRAYVQSQSVIQATMNPSGDIWTGGLNEPKFQVDGSRFDGEWGRPQRDGPALRALAMIPYVHFLLDRDWPTDVEYVERHLYNPTALRQVGSIIKNDLEEVGGGWWLESFDLWEEVSGHHLFTLLACLRALQAGAILAQRLNDAKAAEYYIAQSNKIIDILPAFWDDDLYWRSTAHIDLGDTADDSVHEDRAWLDCAFPLSVIHGGSDDLFGANESETLATLWRYIRSFEGLYHVNNLRQPLETPSSGSCTRPWRDGWGVGRYKEDVYNGIGISKGNPWYICTYAVANVLYLAKEGFEEQGYISLNNLTRPFWQDLLGKRHHGEDELWIKNSEDHERNGTFETALKALVDTGDRFMGVGRAHAPEGRMSEQMDRHDGTPVGARDLTWSYASFLEAARARARAGAGR